MLRFAKVASDQSPSRGAWASALAVATIGGTLLIACMMPFVAVAVATAATLERRPAIATILLVWLVNQTLGFTLLGFPATAYTLAWGAALAAASLAAFAVAEFILRRRGELIATRLALAFAAGFIGYEGLLLAFASVVGGLETFTPAIVAQIALNDGIWFAGLLAFHIGLTRSAPARFGRAPALRLA